MVTASSAAASASSRRPSSLSMLAEVVETHGQIGQEGVGAGLAPAAVDVTASSAAASAASRRPSAQHVAEVVETHGEIGQEGVGPGLRPGAVDRHRLLGRRQRRLPPPQIA